MMIINFTMKFRPYGRSCNIKNNILSKLPQTYHNFTNDLNKGSVQSSEQCRVKCRVKCKAQRKIIFVAKLLTACIITIISII